MNALTSAISLIARRRFPLRPLSLLRWEPVAPQAVWECVAVERFQPLAGSLSEAELDTALQRNWEAGRKCWECPIICALRHPEKGVFENALNCYCRVFLSLSPGKG
ncbi:MAG: hypothetical protein OXM03_02075 [Chloroflexota bacterium]|nr:hypothetical protein [Chloroflexota bacterium]MDE2929315.1 hypothetical protein [Chloroflexota bacterium]